MARADSYRILDEPAPSGLGHLIVFATSNAQTALSFAAILMVTVLAMLFYWAVELVSRGVWWRGVTV